MSLVENLGKDIVTAMKEKDSLKLSVLRMVKGALQLEHINNKKELDDDLFIDVVSKQIKQRNESLEEFTKANRKDLAEKVESEIEILHGIDLKIYEGEFVAIVGESGSGKSTLMNIIGVLDKQTKGEYYLDGIVLLVLERGART